MWSPEACKRSSIKASREAVFTLYQCARVPDHLLTLRRRVIVSWTASSFGAAAIVLESFLPNDEKP
jgi:hypothetical protein